MGVGSNYINCLKGVIPGWKRPCLIILMMRVMIMMMTMMAVIMKMMVRSWLVGVGSNHTSRLLSRTPSSALAITDAFDEDNDDDDGHVMIMAISDDQSSLMMIIMRSPF